MLKKMSIVSSIIAGTLLFSGCNSSNNLVQDFINYSKQQRGILTGVEDISTKTQYPELSSIYAKYYDSNSRIKLAICKKDYMQIKHNYMISQYDDILIKNVDDESARRLENHTILEQYKNFVKQKGHIIKYYSGRLNKEITRNLGVELYRNITSHSTIYSSAIPVLMEYDKNGRLYSIFTATAIQYKNGGISYYGTSDGDFVIYFGDNARKIENRFGGKKLNDYFLREEYN